MIGIAAISPAPVLVASAPDRAEDRAVIVVSDDGSVWQWRPAS